MEKIETLEKLQTKYEKQKRINLEQNQFIDSLKTKISKLQKEIEQEKEKNNNLIFTIKEVMNDINYDVEIGWRKLEKIKEFMESYIDLSKE